MHQEVRRDNGDDPQNFETDSRWKILSGSVKNMSENGYFLYLTTQKRKKEGFALVAFSFYQPVHLIGKISNIAGDI